MSLMLPHTCSPVRAAAQAGVRTVDFVPCRDCGGQDGSLAGGSWAAARRARPLCERVRVLSMRGDDLSWPDPIPTVARFLQAGLIVAVEGRGGFRVLCDATSRQAVTRAREQEPWTEKRFAIMVGDLAAAERLVVLSDAARRALTSPTRPAVAAPRRAEARLTPAVAPDESVVEVTLPTSRLQVLLLAEAQRPLLVSTARVADGASAYWNEEGGRPTSTIADLFLVCDCVAETHREAARN